MKPFNTEKQKECMKLCESSNLIFVQSKDYLIINTLSGCPVVCWNYENMSEEITIDQLRFYLIGWQRGVNDCKSKINSAMQNFEIGLI